MGLDIYVYKVRRLNDEEIERLNGLSYDELLDKYAVFDCTDATLHCGEYADIVPYLRKITGAPTKRLDMAKIMKDNDIPEGCNMTGRYISQYVGFYFSSPDGEDNKEVVLNNTEQEKYTITTYDDYFVCDTEKVLYWRKEYDLEEMLYDAYPNIIYNCGYHKLNDEMVRIIHEYELANGKTLPDGFGENNDGQCYCYHEWY